MTGIFFESIFEELAAGARWYFALIQARNVSGVFIAGLPATRPLLAGTGMYFPLIIDFKISHLYALSKSPAFAFSRRVICPSRCAQDCITLSRYSSGGS